MALWGNWGPGRYNGCVRPRSSHWQVTNPGLSPFPRPSGVLSFSGPISRGPMCLETAVFLPYWRWAWHEPSYPRHGVSLSSQPFRPVEHSLLFSILRAGPNGKSTKKWVGGLDRLQHGVTEGILSLPRSLSESEVFCSEFWLFPPLPLYDVSKFLTISLYLKEGQIAVHTAWLEADSGLVVKAWKLTAWVQIPTSPLLSCVTLSKLLHQPVTQFLHMKNGANNSTEMTGLLPSLNEIEHGSA